MIKNFLSKFERKTLIRAGIAILIYLLWVIWLGNYWFLLGLPVVFDMYLTKKVNWSPWKKRNGDNNMIIEWLDALIFAVIAVTIINIFLFQNYKIPTGSMEKSLQVGDHLYVSKVAYGPRIPNTPLALPFMSNSIWGTKKKSFLTWPQWDYKRLKGFGQIKRWDPVVFNFPTGDTVCFERSNVSYYQIVREVASGMKSNDIQNKKPIQSYKEYYNRARKWVWNEYTMVVRPVDKTDNYIKRCVGIPGDSLEIIDGVLYINGEQEPEIPGRQKFYEVHTGNKMLISRHLTKLGIYKEDIHKFNHSYVIPLTKEMYEQVSVMKNVDSITSWEFMEYDSVEIFPHTSKYPWSVDNYGPIYIPKKGVTTRLNLKNIHFYKRIIGHYEKNDLEIKDSTIYINGNPTDNYTFKMNYYWMMGDNRHSSLDSRIWGYVPEDHIIGKPKFIWLSIHKEKEFPKNIQIKRMFRKIK
jgi:signal peptidase I